MKISLPTLARRLGNKLLLVGLIAAAALITFLTQQWLISAQQTVDRKEIGRQLLNKNQPLEAAIVFEDVQWRAVANFRATRYRRASELYQTLDTPEATYNYGVSIARLRRWDDAIAAFRVVLDADPNHVDARHNYDLLQDISEGEKQQPRRNEGADQGGALHEDSEAEGDGEPNAGSDKRSDNEDIIAEPSPGAQPPQEQSETPDSTSGQSGQDAEGRSPQSMPTPPTEPSNQSLVNLGGEDADNPPDSDAAQDDVQSDAMRASEAALAEAMQMRRLSDDAAVVLEARLRAAAKSNDKAAQ